MTAVTITPLEYTAPFPLLLILIICTFFYLVCIKDRFMNHQNLSNKNSLLYGSSLGGQGWGEVSYMVDLTHTCIMRSEEGPKRDFLFLVLFLFPQTYRTLGHIIIPVPHLLTVTASYHACYNYLQLRAQVNQLDGGGHRILPPTFLSLCKSILGNR